MALIDNERLIHDLIQILHDDVCAPNGHLDPYYVFKTIKEQPSTQPEIIRCKDCKHYNAGFECLIEGYGIERNKDWYCADAERRTDG